MVMVSLRQKNTTEMNSYHQSHHLDTKVCEGAVTLATTWIGKAKDVEMKSVFCPDLHQRHDVQQVLEPQTAPPPKNVCGAPCRFSHDFLFHF